MEDLNNTITVAQILYIAHKLVQEACGDWALMDNNHECGMYYTNGISDLCQRIINASCEEPFNG